MLLGVSLTLAEGHCMASMGNARRLATLQIRPYHGLQMDLQQLNKPKGSSVHLVDRAALSAWHLPDT